MINKRNIITISISLLLLLFINLFSDVKVEYLTMSLTEYRNFSLNCGTVYDILVNRVEYTDKLLLIYLCQPLIGNLSKPAKQKDEVAD